METQAKESAGHARHYDGKSDCPCRGDHSQRTPRHCLCKDSDWKKSLDKGILQKVLPKIHGNRRQLGDCLRALESFLGGDEGKYTMGREEIKTGKTGIVLASSQKKVGRMRRTLEYTGYTSFIS